MRRRLDFGNVDNEENTTSSEGWDPLVVPTDSDDAQKYSPYPDAYDSPLPFYKSIGYFYSVSTDDSVIDDTISTEEEGTRIQPFFINLCSSDEEGYETIAVKKENVPEEVEAIHAVNDNKEEDEVREFIYYIRDGKVTKFLQDKTF